MRKLLKLFDIGVLVTALMGASPETNSLCKRLFPDIDFEMIKNNIGRARIETAWEMQNQIMAMVNLQSLESEI